MQFINSNLSSTLSSVDNIDMPQNNNNFIIVNSKTVDSELHWQVVERILFIYSKLNPGIKYVQVCLNFKIEFSNILIKCTLFC